MLAREKLLPSDAEDLFAELILFYSQGVIAPGARQTGGGKMDSISADEWPERSSIQISNTVQGLALIAAYEAALAVASEVRLEPVLQRIVDLSRTVVSARYAALGVVDDQGKIARLFVSGLTADEVAALGPIPEGHGLLSMLMNDAGPLRVKDVKHHPDAVGFPPHHPPMSSLVGVPIRFNGQVLGTLYLADAEQSDEFTDGDVVALRILADHAASAIDRARLYRTVEEGQQQAEEQLSQLREILNTLPAGVLVMAPPDAHVTLANTTAMGMIYGKDAVQEQHPAIDRDFIWQDVDGARLSRDAHPGVRALRGETLGNRQLILQDGAWDPMPVLVQSAPLRSGAGDVVGAVVVFQDVSRLRAAEQVKDDFLSLISHEFRTPLTAIHGGAHLLATRDDVLDDETRKELLEDIVVESGRLDRMLANLLRVSEVMAGRFQASTEPILISPLVQLIIDDFRRRSPEFTFTLDVPADAPLAEGDPELLRQILQNLYENAVKYSPNGGAIHTSARRDGEWVSLRIRDQGLGIAAEHVAAVFERFRRPGADPTVRGMGVGLYLSRLLVDAQGGRIRASSPGPGKGATFVVDLPIASEWVAGEVKGE